MAKEKKSGGGSRKAAPGKSKMAPDLPGNISTGGILATPSPSTPPAVIDAVLGEVLAADATDEYSDIAPSFGEVLLSIGSSVAASQDLLDRGLVETAKQLSDTKITYVSEVIQELNDDGLPDLNNSELVEREVSLINFVSPTVHEWKYVGISMDLNVGEFDVEKGVRFSRKQSSFGGGLSLGGGGMFSVFSGFGLFGGFNIGGSTSKLEVTNTSEREMDWASGQVRVDSLLGPRRTQKFPVPAEIAIGPQLFFSQGAVQETENDRSMEVMIRVLKANGDVNSGISIEVDGANLGVSFADNNITDVNGEIRVTLTRRMLNPQLTRASKHTITARLGQIERQLSVSL